MNFKDTVFLNFKAIKNLILGTMLSLVALAFRVKLTHDFYLIFLAWNLLLALLPFVLTLAIHQHPHWLSHRWKRMLLTLLWLLFLPNAPYILTDFIHLQNSTPNMIGFDLALIALFSATGFLAGVYSIKLMLDFNRPFNSTIVMKLAVITICLLCGYGVYLGRFIRLNSWDVFTNPQKVVIESIVGLGHGMSWFITLTIGLLLFCSLRHLETKKTGIL